jgi:predicted oxidoreductase
MKGLSMRTMKLGQSDLSVPVIALGCFRINRLSNQEAARHIQTALDQGVNFFDHADSYGGGICESIFAEALGTIGCPREKVIIQSKCGNIRGKMYNSSKDYIVQAVEGSLKRLKTDYLDVLLLHKPDILVEPDEVAEAFDLLYESGKVRHFGVSNHNPRRMQLLQETVRQPLVANQLQLSIPNATMITSGVAANVLHDEALDHDGHVLDFCRLNKITIQVWGAFQFGDHLGIFLDNDQFPELNAKLGLLAEKYHVSNSTIVIAWLLRHPANMLPIVGTMTSDRLRECAEAAEIQLSREEWYEIYRAAGHLLP